MLLLWPIGGKHGRAIDAEAEKGREETIRAQRFSPPLLRTSSPPLFRSPLRSLGSSSGGKSAKDAITFTDAVWAVWVYGKGISSLVPILPEVFARIPGIAQVWRGCHSRNWDTNPLAASAAAGTN